MKQKPDQIGESGRKRFVSLRTKFILFISLIIVSVCSSLSWYMVRQQAESMSQALMKTGLMVVKNLAHNSRYNLITQDKIALERLLEGTMNVEEVVYVVMSGPEVNILIARSKGRLSSVQGVGRMPEKPFFPDPKVAKSLLNAETRTPLITLFTIDGQVLREVSNQGKARQVMAQLGRPSEVLFDFAISVRRRASSEPLLGPLSFEQQEEALGPKPSQDASARIYGIIQVGLTNAKMLETLRTVIWNIVLITLLIIALGIAATALLANRIITPLRSLARVAERVAEGDWTTSVSPTTHDEVGQLSTIFNQMTQAIKDREQAISSQVDTITKQVNKLTTLNQTGVAIVSNLDLDNLLTTVLHRLVEKVGFTHMLLMLYDSERGVAFGAQTAGISDELGRAARKLEVVVEDDGTLHAEVLLRGNVILVSDLATIAHRIPPPFLHLLQELRITSFVCAPLKSQQHILGLVAADSTPNPSIQEDLDLLVTIANTIGVAIDNAKAYKKLEQFTVTLEQRVDERTQELQTANAKLKELDQIKSAFVSTASHELRTPMTSIKGLVENMLHGLTGELNERQVFYLSRVRVNVERLTRMINDLLDLSRIEAGRMELRPISLSLPELVTEVVDSLQSAAKERGLSLQIQPHAALPTIRGDQDMISQVLTNLIHNAIKFTPPEGHIRIELAPGDDGYIQLCVADTGCGISPEELGTIFERFYRAKSVPFEARGAGLGLPITKSLVELHGGRIWAESTLGEGSRFFVTLPIQGPPS
ncbi:MAG: ATP-binding protein [Nitrospirales bacterium]